MKNKIENFELVENLLSEQEKEEIVSGNRKLVELSGASLSFSELTSDSVTVQVNNVNGKRTSKAELLNTTYKMLKKNIPERYRLSIKL